MKSVKNILLIAVLLMGFGVVYAQEDFEESLEYKFQSNNKFSLDFSYGMLSWSNSGKIMDCPENVYSLELANGQRWDLSIFYNIELGKVVDFSIGIGYESDVFVFSNNVEWFPHQNIQYSSQENDGKLVARYFTIPLNLSVNFYKDLDIFLGVKTMVNFRTPYTGFKRNYNQEKLLVEESWGSAYNNFAPFRFDVKVGLSWYGVYFYVNHSLTSIFKDNKEKTLLPWGFGLGVRFL